MTFDEFFPGRIIKAGPYALTESEIVEFARSFDPQWFHLDAKAAHVGRWGGLIASGWHTCAIAMRLACDAALRDSESWGSPGLEYLRWPYPVRPGDRLMFVATVIDATRSNSLEGLGIVKWRWQLTNQQNKEVLDLVATSFFQVDRR